MFVGVCPYLSARFGRPNRCTDEASAGGFHGREVRAPVTRWAPLLRNAADHQALLRCAEGRQRGADKAQRVPKKNSRIVLSSASEDYGLDLNLPAIGISGVSRSYTKYVAASSASAPEISEGDEAPSPKRGVLGMFSTGQRKKPSKKRKQTVQAVNDVSFNVEGGTIYALLGPNSSGKTTLMRMLTTLERPDKGGLSFYGIDIVRYPDIARQMFGYVMQDAGVDKVLTGREHLNLFAKLAHLSRAEARENISSAIELLKLEPYCDNLTATYSGGIKKRLDIAIALLLRPAILILDEPTVGLDFDSRAIIWGVLREYRENGGTVLISTHYLEEADLLADRVGILDGGSLISEGKVRDLKERVGGDRVSIRLSEFCSVAEAERALNVLDSVGSFTSGIINISASNALELVVPRLSDGGARLLSTLKSAGFDDIFSFTVSKPSLGDVYLAATGRSLDVADAMGKEQRDIKQMRKESMS
eukprot:CAMPEP_0185840290 /NCGR_PEP_ID=MMETSP1353-20130828/16009_1 /TAXON_ID=1077150 /ORGANISM="Erythrolobus australicus, Strain CCMP3124" /LENGTH=474 /DNA_ID=CAMNT_0028539605 /DNA_START=29 /DNA_END=1453 /DNA_ORIENTATION=-